MIDLRLARRARRRSTQGSLARACVVTAAITFLASHVVLALWPSARDLVVAAPTVEKPLAPQPGARALPPRPGSSARPGRPTAPEARNFSPSDPSAVPPAPTRSSREPIHVYFVFDGEELSDHAKAVLRPLIRALERDSALSVQLDGYTDASGDPLYNVHLSRRRVAAVERHLVDHRIEPERIQSIGRGALADRATADSDKRRVTATLVFRPR